MNTIFALLFASSAIADETPDFISSPLENSEEVVEETPFYFIGGDFLPMVGTSTFAHGKEIRVFSINYAGFSGSVHGAEVGAVFNINRGDMNGFQGAGYFNLTMGNMRGVQTAGAFNYATGAHGGQLAPVNIASSKMNGIQAGVTNFAGDLTGAQVGVVNISSGNSGVQFGLVNISKNVDFAFGLVNVVTDGRFHADTWIDEKGFYHAGIKTGGNYFHNIYALGRSTMGNEEYGSFTLGYGLHRPIGSRFHMDLDLLHESLILIEPFDNHEYESINTLRGVMGLRLFRKLTVYGGPSLNVLTTTRKIAPFGLCCDQDLAPNPDVGVYMWAGWNLGIQL